MRNTIQLLPAALAPKVRTLALIFLLAQNLRTLALKSPACARGSRKPCTLTLEHPNLLKSYPNPCTLALKRPNLLKSYPNPCTLGQNLCTLALKSPAYPTLPCLRSRVHGFYPAVPFFTLLKAESTWFLPHLTLLYQNAQNPSKSAHWLHTGCTLAGPKQPNLDCRGS